VRRLAVGVVVLFLYGWFLAATEVSFSRLVRGIPWMADFLRRMFPPDLAVLGSAVVGALQTLQIAVVGTTVAALLALPLGFLSARNVTSGPVFYPARALLNFFRSIDTMVYALFFVAAWVWALSGLGRGDLP
jgi:phosphonate transport system permease protein